MKKLLFIVGILAITAVIFGIGYYVGIYSDSMMAMINTDLFEKETIKASETIMVLEMINDGKINDAIEYLNLTLDGQVLLISNLLPDVPNEKNKKTAQRILKRIAIYRDKYSEKFPEEIQKEESDVNRRIRDILRKALERE